MADNKTGLSAPVTNGVLEYSASSETKKATQRGSSELGKDAFLQLLVAQMQYQDPLNPSDNTEYISQLAQFSQLEQLQNLSGESEKSQAFSLVGKYVTFKITDAAGKTTFPEGTVDYVNMTGKKLQLSVNGTVYDYDKLCMVADNEYIAKQNIPKIDMSYNFNINAKDPEDMEIKVDFGKDDFKASEVAVVVGGQTIDGSYLHYKDDTITIDGEAMKDFENGSYPVSIIFNNAIYTTVSDKVNVTVFNSEK